MRVFIGCGTTAEIDEKYYYETRKLCQKLCDLDCSLVFGASNKGMMGVCYHTFKDNHKSIKGIGLTVTDETIDLLPNIEIIHYSNSSDRVHMIFEESDIFVILPGGIGTLSEFFGILEEFKTNPKNKKIILYNYDNYYDPLIAFINENNKRKFVRDSDISHFVTVTNPDELAEQVKNTSI